MLASLIVEQKITVPHSKAQCFAAALSVINNAEGYVSIDSSELTGSIQAKRKFSGVGYGENISIIVSSAANGETQIYVSSSPKAPYMLWRSKSEKNVRFILSELDKALRELDVEPAQPAAEQQDNESSVENRLIQLNDLKDKGLITDDEYRRKKEDILKSI